MRWLVALDESEFSERILGWMRTFPHPRHRVVTVVYVLEPVEHPETLGAKGQALVRQQQGTQRLLAYAPYSPMLVPGKVTPGRGLRVMVATDGSPEALRAAGLVEDLPVVQEIVVVSFVRPLGAAQAVLDRFQRAESRAMRADLLRSRRAAARKAIAVTREALKGRPANIRAAVFVGHPAGAIVRAARRDGWMCSSSAPAGLRESESGGARQRVPRRGSARDLSGADREALARIIHDSSAAIADPLLRQACGRRARPSDPRRTARVRLWSSGLRAPVSQRGWAISQRTAMNNTG